MLLRSVLSVALVFVVCQVGWSQDPLQPFKRSSAEQLQELRERAGKVEARSSQRPSGDRSVHSEARGVRAFSTRTPGPSVTLDVLIARVVFDEQGELRVDREGAEPEVNRAGTIATNLAAKLKEQRKELPAGVSVGAAGANFLLAGLAGEKKLELLEQFQMRLGADGTEVRLQDGRREPHITGSSVRDKHLTNMVSFESMGTMITASARVTKPEKVGLQISVERSSFGPEEEGTPVSVHEEKIIRTPRIDTMTMNTQTTVPAGEPTVLTSVVRSSGNKVTETFVLVTATVVEE